jgi:hypothetical protein
VPELFQALESSDGQTRALVAQVLARTLGRSETLDWASASAGHRREAADEWLAWYQDQAHLPRTEWVREALATSGVELPDGTPTRDSLRGLVEALDDPEPINYLAARTLTDLTGFGPPPAEWNTSRRRTYWMNLIDQWQP